MRIERSVVYQPCMVHIPQEQRNVMREWNEADRERSARNPFMFRFTLKVIHALEVEAKRCLYKALDAACSTVHDSKEIEATHQRLKAVNEILRYYEHRLQYFEKGAQ